MAIGAGALTTKLERMLGPDGPVGLGLEIGALDAPLVRKGAHDVRYVDYAETAVVRANQFDPAVRIDEIVDVDIVWGKVRLARAVGEPVDYVIASHVIEHVPDLIGWLDEIAEALKAGGVLGLAVPDKRFTFDALRRESGLAEAIEAWLEGARRPSLRQVFDAASLGVAVDAAEVWAGRFEPTTRRAEVLDRLAPALGLARSLHASPRYNDAHCWVFTPNSFLDLAEELATLQLFPFRVDAFHPAEPGGAEFLVRLVRAPTPADADILESIRQTRIRLPVEVPAAPEPMPPDACRAERIAALEAELAALRRSHSWRITAPLRAISRRIVPRRRS
jgi:hypothetical protein